MHHRISRTVATLCLPALALLAFSPVALRAEDDDDDRATIEALRQEIAEKDALLALKDRRIAELESPDATITGECTTVAHGAVGEPGRCAQLLHHVGGAADSVVVLENARTSLCPDTGAVGVLVVNGIPLATGSLTAAGSSIRIRVRPGDEVCAILATVPLQNGIQCFRLGELECDLKLGAPGE